MYHIISFQKHLYQLLDLITPFYNYLLIIYYIYINLSRSWWHGLLKKSIYFLSPNKFSFLMIRWMCFSRIFSLWQKTLLVPSHLVMWMMERQMGVSKGDVIAIAVTRFLIRQRGSESLFNVLKYLFIFFEFTISVPTTRSYTTIVNFPVREFFLKWKIIVFR